MAKSVNYRDKSENVLQLISCKEIIQIYVQSFLIVFYIALRNFILIFKCFFDKQYTATKRMFVKQFRLFPLAIESSNENKQNTNGCDTVISPATQTSKFGAHKYIIIKKSRFHYVEKGEQNDRNSIILLLHGFADCFFGWRNQIDVLSQKHRVIALDLKGFNDSDKPLMRHQYKPNRICNELKCFLQMLEIKSVCIIGHDLGAILGWIFALKYPDYVNKFISISTPHPNLFWNTSKGSIMSTYWFNMIQIPILPENEISKDHSFIHEIHRHSMNRVENNRVGGYKRNNVIETYEYIFSRPEDWTGALNYFRNLIFYRIKPGYSIRCPTILIFGTECSRFKLESAIKSSEYCENALIKVIDGADYWAHQTHSAQLNEILLKYLLGDRKSDEECEDVKPNSSLMGKSLVSRMMNKVYSVGQQYGPLSSNGMFS